MGKCRWRDEEGLVPQHAATTAAGRARHEGSTSRNRLQRQKYTAFTAVVWLLGFSPRHADEEELLRNVRVDTNPYGQRKRAA